MNQQNPFDQIFATWTQMWADAAETAGMQSDIFDLAMQAVDLRRWFGLSAEQSMEMMRSLPQFAFPMLDRKLLALAAGWMSLMQCNNEHNLKIMQAWANAYGEFCSDLNAAAAKGEPVHADRKLFERLITAINRKMQEVQRSDDFLASQRNLMDAFLLSRAREREIVEMVANAFDLPTRTEMDDAHRSVHDLKREVRALRRELDDLRLPARPDTGHAPSRLLAERRDPGARSQGGGS